MEKSLQEAKEENLRVSDSLVSLFWRLLHAYSIAKFPEEAERGRRSRDGQTEGRGEDGGERGRRRGEGKTEGREEGRGERMSRNNREKVNVVFGCGGVWV